MYHQLLKGGKDTLDRPKCQAANSLSKLDLAFGGETRIVSLEDRILREKA
jgi:hypothetical protein